MLNQRSNKLELLRIAEAVATEKSIDKEIILTSMESAIQKAAKTKFGSENDIRAIINRESGDISLHKVLKIVEKPEKFFSCYHFWYRSFNRREALGVFTRFDTWLLAGSFDTNSRR